jgi:hypothetical protein
MYDSQSQYNLNDKHPQFALIKRHIERAVQDLFLDSLRNNNDQLVYLFTEENQIDGFIERILKYWESLEDYETCKEVVSLSGEFKNKWKNKEDLPPSPGFIRLKSLFDTHE